MEALRWKQAIIVPRTDAKMAIATQSAFEAKRSCAWADHLRAEAVIWPIHIGIAGPWQAAKTLIKFANCLRIGPSL